MIVFDEPHSLKNFLSSRTLRPFRTPNRILMATPQHFDVKYSINPHMLSESGHLQKIDKEKAERQWKALVECYKGLGLQVEILPSDPHLPDLVFTANHALVWQWADEGSPHVLMGRMRSPFRQPEIALFENWYKSNGYQVHSLSTQEGFEGNGSGCFEGNGDALLFPSAGLVIGAFGPRTDKRVYDAIAKEFDIPIVRLELISDDFYHLDTCFSILNSTTAVLCPAALSKPGIEMLYQLFENIIEIERKEARCFFSCNCHSPNGRNLLTQAGDASFIQKAEDLGFQCHPLDTSEFIKAGGSVFCLKMMVY